MIEIAAYIFSFFILFVIAFQTALALGVPWGEYAMGGKYPGKFPPAIRIAAVIQIVILLFFEIMVLSRTNMAFVNLYEISRAAIWFVVGFFIIGSILNTITPSKKERMLWAPVNIIMLTASLVIALN